MERAEKAYKNLDFLKSSAARTIRILAEYLEPKKRFDEANIKHTVVFFGSSRVRPEKGDDPLRTSKYYWAAEEFAFNLASWSKELEKEGEECGFTICTGGGPGIMEAANRGAKRANAKSIGMNISIPFEQEPNDYITPTLNFEFHYFFMRKLWFLYHAKALVIFPGGFGTMDELFETLTLVQTQKLPKHNIPILLYDPGFWKDLINFPKLVEYGMISPEDVNLFHYFSTPDEGMSYLKPRLQELIKNFNSG
ncbi:MAG: TIGR00730 family Rossman fold protein [Candidatus Aminicenantes bacterium]|nr:TIGR00730 family Rossman fold protein [Candidatus Aminicenantes bacterium]NIM85033.1 TIGR00730 family Rossman fold protein [Candidatus Aminicenantes bacterium]NIN24547.1 TIGR00730 family Rossman fold protein [Candidatus Aminicenantes bacterium]NIN48311.1 TIGR00730 family Rossman fold protein [Candidatus Aminicenantes bacterium]NIN91214.1 TIGR00730 family Rossman fold protein [Candidatus Aminicenantes bacterium]